MEIISREYEELFLNSIHIFNQKPCIKNENCIAYKKFKIILPIFLTPEKKQNFNFLCLLCLRYEITEKWLHYKIEQTPIIIQPYANRLQDYDNDLFILENNNRFYGFIHPFVRYSTFNYQSGKNKIIQINMEPRMKIYLKFNSSSIILPRYLNSNFIDLTPFILHTRLFSKTNHPENEFIVLLNKCLFFNRKDIPAIENLSNTYKDWLLPFIEFHVTKFYPWASTIAINQNVYSIRFVILEAICYFIYQQEYLLNNHDWMYNLIHECNHFRQNGKYLNEIHLKPVDLTLYETLYLKFTRTVKVSPDFKIDYQLIKPYHDLFYRLRNDIKLKGNLDEHSTSFISYVTRYFENKAIVHVPYTMDENLLVRENWFVCLSCRSVKADYKSKLVDSKPTFYGNQNIYFNTNTNKICCRKNKQGGRKTSEEFYLKQNEDLIVPIHCDRECKEVIFGKHIIVLFNKAYLPCSKCKQVGIFNQTRLLNNNICKYCMDQINKREIKCLICLQMNKNKRDWVFKHVMIDGGLSPCEKVYFCTKHNKLPFLNEHEVWSLPFLEHTIKEYYQKNFHHPIKKKQRHLN
jgi:hypothetical protein